MTDGAGVRRIGNRYRLGEPLGRGGMGVVWAATDELLGRAVAVKEVIPPPGLSAGQAELTRTRSMREARAAARIRSSSAVNVFDVVEEDGRPWIVMELLDARPLSELIDTDGPMPPARVAEMARQLLGALTAAHASGVLHRDVKPSNVMIERGGRVVLTDFGIAALDGDPALTTTGMLIGSPAYIAPERVHGQPASSASDLWSLGCTMFAALEGRPPFHREGSLATLGAVITEEPLPAPSAGPLAPVIAGLLRKDPHERLTAEQTDRLLRDAIAVPTAPMREQTRNLGPLSGETTGVLPVLPPTRPTVAAAPAPVQSVPVAPVQPAPPPRPGRSRAKGVALAASAVALVAVVAGGVVLLAGTGDDETARTGGAAVTTTSADTATDTTGSTTQATTDAVATSSAPTDDATALPAGFRLHTDDTGFAVAVPVDWAVTKEGSRTDFTEPGTGRFLRVDQTRDPQPDPVADWQNQAASAADRLPGYEQIRIEPVDYRDYDAADWEFTWEADGGRLHVLNRNLITGPDRAYALYWNTPDERWQESLSVFETITRTFQPAA